MSRRMRSLGEALLLAHRSWPIACVWIAIGVLGCAADDTEAATAGADGGAASGADGTVSDAPPASFSSAPGEGESAVRGRWRRRGDVLVGAHRFREAVAAQRPRDADAR